MFDPHLEWLGIPTDRRPPTYYQLLGIFPAERDPRRIEEAAARQVEHLREHRFGPYAVECAQLLAEIAQAKATLTDPARRAAYDARLGIQPPKAPAPPPAPLPIPVPPPAPPRAAAPLAPEPVPLAESAPSAFAPDDEAFRARRPRRKQGSGAGLAVGLALAALLIGGGVVGVLALRNPSPATAPEQAKANPKAELPETSPAEPSPPPKQTRPEPKRPPKKESTAPTPDPAPAPPPPAMAASAREARTWKPHAGAVRAVAVAPDGGKLLTAGEDMAVFAFAPDADKPAKLATLGSPAIGAGFLPDGSPVVADGGAIKVLEPAGAVRQQIGTPAGGFESLAVGGEGKLILTGSTDGSVRLWAVGQEKPLCTFEVSAKKAVTAVALSADGQLAFAGCADGTLSAWDATGKLLKRWKAHGDAVTAVALTPDGKRAISGGADKSAVIWDAVTGQPLKRLPGHGGPVLAAAFVAGGRYAATAGVDGVLRLWETEGGRLVRSFDLGGRVYSLAADPSGRFLLAGCGDGVVRLQPLPPTISIAAGKPPAERYAVPKETDLAPALAAIREAHKEDLKRDKPDELLDLADLFQAKATAVEETPLNRFAYFQAAREQAAKAGSAERLMKVIDALDDWFEVDGLLERTAALEALGESLPEAARKPVGEEALRLLARAERESRPELVERLLKTASAAAQASASKELADQADAVVKRLQAAALARGEASAAAARLKDKPDDPEANFIYGRHLCFTKGEWERGLPMLAKGKDRPLAELAKRDLAGPKEPAEQAKLAGTWWDLAETADENAKVHLYGRAKHWYEKAVASGLTGLDKVEAATRIKKVEKLTAGPAPMPKDNPMPVVGKEPPPPPQPNAVVRRNFNAVRTEATAKSQWTIQGNYRFDKGGMLLQDNSPQLASKFQLLENWQVTITLFGDGRELSVTACGEHFSVPAANKAPVMMVVSRRGAKLSYAALDAQGKPTAQQTIDLMPDKQGPSPITVGLLGNPAREDGALLRGVVISGAVRPGE